MEIERKERERKKSIFGERERDSLIELKREICYNY